MNKRKPKSSTAAGAARHQTPKRQATRKPRPVTAPKIQIDGRVKELVWALSKVPGIRTLSSCGGHPAPTLGQAPEDHFFVNFEVDRTLAGWKSLDRLVLCVGENPFPTLHVKAWAASDEPGSLAFELRGETGDDPLELATAIVKAFGLGGQKRQ